MGAQIRGGQFGGRLSQQPGNVERDIAVADDRDRLAIERWREVAGVGNAVVPGHESPRAIHSIEVFTGNAETAIFQRADGDDEYVIGCLEFFVGNVATDGDVAEKAHTFLAQRAFKLTRDVLGALMVRRDATAHQAEGRRQAVENIDAGAG